MSFLNARLASAFQARSPCCCACWRRSARGPAGAAVSLGRRCRGRRSVCRGRSVASGDAGRLRRRHREPAGARARARAAVRLDQVRLDRSVHRARRRRDRTERHRGYGGAARHALADHSVLHVPRSPERPDRRRRALPHARRPARPQGRARSATRSRTTSCCAPSAITASRRCRTRTTCIRTATWCSDAWTPSCSTTCSPSGGAVRDRVHDSTGHGRGRPLRRRAGLDASGAARCVQRDPAPRDARRVARTHFPEVGRLERRSTRAVRAVAGR